MNSAYRLHDLLLGRVLDLAGPDTAVMLLSDHGFHSDHLRLPETPAVPTGPTVHHRDHGILVMAGPGIRKDERIHGAGLLDIAPTALTMMGLPVGADMPGRVLVEAFDQPPLYRAIPSWETEPGEAGRHGPDVRIEDGETSLLLEQFAALGYLDPDEMEDSGAPEAVRREADWNLARCHADANEPEIAIPILERLCAAWPERSDFGLALCNALCAIGAYTEAEALAEAMAAHQRAHPALQFVLGSIAVAKGDAEQAMIHLAAAAKTQVGRPEFQVQIGTAALRLKDRAMAERSFAAAVALDPDLASARTGMAAVALERGDWLGAERHALSAIAIDFQTPMAHWLLADARLRQGRVAEADLALQVATLPAPDWLPVRQLRAQLWARFPGHPNQVATQADLVAATARAEARKVRRAGFLDASHQSARRLLMDTYTASGARQAEQANVQVLGDAATRETILLVSGLPRSGTSLVMQMLRLGGASILTDGARKADEDNPEGYLEWRPLNRLPRHPEVLRAAPGHVLKLLTPLVPFLPRRYVYRVIFLDRPIDEVVASQTAMRRRLGRPIRTDPLRMRTAQAAHRAAALKHLRDTALAEVLVVPYPALVTNPADWAARIAAFLGPEVVPYPDRMPGAIRGNLYRQRAAALDQG